MVKIHDIKLYGQRITPIMPQFCNICGKLDWGWKTEKIGFYGEYGFHDKYTYHRKCVYDAIKNPEKYGHKAVDVAIDVFRCIEYWTTIAKEQDYRDTQYREAELLAIRKAQGLK